MADIRAFRGLLYNPTKVSMERVLAPPYDVLDDAGRQALADKDPHNCVQVILPTAPEGEDKYDAASTLLQKWKDEGVLQRDEQESIYCYHQVFRHEELGEEKVIRRGIIAAVRLHNFDEGVILRHERTLKGPKIDRLNLWERSGHHLSQIFTLYSDPQGTVDQTLAHVVSEPPYIEGTTDDGTQHRLWRIADPAVVAAVSAQLQEASLYIADGHHRYETMLALRDRRIAENPDLPEDASARFGMMFLANIDDPGLVVLPTHRKVHSLASFDAGDLRTKLSEYFSCDEVAGGALDAKALRKAITEAGTKGTSLALLLPGEKNATILTLRPEIDLRAIGLQGADATLSLDVTLLHDLVLDRILGIDRKLQEAQAHIAYIKDTGKALKECASGAGQAYFIMNATKVSQVVAVSDADEVMPQKSTFFYPKIASGMVFAPVIPGESIKAS